MMHMENVKVLVEKSELKDLIREVVLEVVSELKDRDEVDVRFDIEQAASFLNLAVSTLYEKTSNRSIPHYKKGKKLMFKKSELIRWWESRQVSTTEDIKKIAVNRNTKNGQSTRDRYL